MVGIPDVASLIRATSPCVERRAKQAAIGQRAPRKIFRFTEFRNCVYFAATRPKEEGRIAIVTNAGQDAMAAAALARKGIAGRVSRERSQGAIDEQRMLRTMKSCGPDASTLVSSFAEACRPNRARTHL